MPVIAERRTSRSGPLGRQAHSAGAALLTGVHEGSKLEMFLSKLAFRPGFWGRIRDRGNLGIAMLEVILAIGVIGIIIGGVIVLFTSAQERQKRTDTTSLINQVRAGVESTFATSGNYTGLSMQLLYDRGKVPDSAYNGTTFNHPFGNLIEVYPIGTGGKRFWLGLRGLDEGACEDILGTYIGMTRSRAGIVLARVDDGADPTVALAVPSGADGSGTGDIVNATMPYNLAQVNGACEGGDGQHNVWFLFG
ncbi:MAG: hypothetical protein OXE40_11685 [Gammaproteobacteria bacterium]|nr:hypothetical protein [Gammaproteobacteria bacterium]